MVVHRFECLPCDREAQVYCPISEVAHAPACEGCGEQMSRVWTAPTAICKGHAYKEVPNVVGSGRKHGISAAAEERIHQRNVADRRALALAANRARKGTRRADTEARVVASIPFHRFVSRQRQFGHDYWQDDPVGKARKDGCAFE